MYDNGDILLFALSARRQTSWRILRRYFDEIERRVAAAMVGQDATEVAASRRWRALRDWSALGHIDLELGANGIQVHVASPVLAVLPGLGTPKSVLCGARSPNYIEELQRESKIVGVEVAIESQASTSSHAPSRIELYAEDAAQVKSLAGKIGAHYAETPPARLMAHTSISLPDYRQNLAWTNDPELNWHCEDFDTERLQFRAPSELRPEQRLSRYRDPATQVWHYRLWHNKQSAEVAPDWGRYAVLAMTNQRVLRYFPETRQVLAPLGAPLPTLLARAFGLCTGNCPVTVRVDQSNPMRRHLRFKGVPPSVFNKVAVKLGQEPQRAR